MHISKCVIFLSLVFLIVIRGEVVLARSIQEKAQDGYSVHPPDISVPDGEPGAVRRSLMQFYGWTLICDELLQQKKIVCNVTQTVRDQDNNVVFSWSLAATDDGRPFLLLRTPANTNKDIPVTLMIKGGETVKVAFIGCDKHVCLAQTPVGPILTNAIKGEAVVEIAYQTNENQKIIFNTSLKGLGNAVQSIR